MKKNETFWVNKVLHGDDKAFNVLVDQYKNPVFGLCYRMLGDYHEAEDAAQESFLRAYIHLKKYDPNRSFATWLLSITAHYCIDQIRKKHVPIIPADAISEELIADRSSNNPELRMKQMETEELIESLLMTLKPLDRGVTVLRYWHEYSEIEIAEALNLSVSAVKSRLYRSRQFLAKCLRESESTPISKIKVQNESSAI